MSNPSPVTHSIDADGIGWITLVDPAGRAPILNPVTLAALRMAVEKLAAQPLKAVVVRGAKEKIFLAGADLKWLAALPDAPGATKVAREGQEIFELLANLKVPVVAVIHGACAGGGYELALACHWRIATAAQETRIGLPEVGLGLIPCWGGCVRLPRLIGSEAAAAHILRADLVPAALAHQTGLVDELVPVAELTIRARATALRLAAEGLPRRPVPAEGSPDFFALQRREVLTGRPGQPAPLAALDVIEQTAGLPLAPALDLEAALFGSVAAGEVAKNLIRMFFLKAAARKATVDAWYPGVPAVAGAAPPPFRIVGIVGAGVMGAGIAQWLAGHGCGVILCDTERAAVEHGVKVIRSLFKEAERRGELTAAESHRMMGGIGITTSLEDFEGCELVIEAIVENLAEKQKIFTELSAVMAPDCVLASTSAALALEELASGVREPGRVVGLHFCNPVSRMPLVEVALSPQTTRGTAEQALAFVRALGKTPVLSKPARGSLVMRVLAFYLNEACRLWEEGVAAAVIERAARDWGWSMGPLRLIDEMGVETMGTIFSVWQRRFPERFIATTICHRLAAAGLKGRRNGAGDGFYSYAGEQEVLNPALEKMAPAGTQAMEARAVTDRLNAVMLDETRRALAEGVVKTPEEADLALVLGAGFPAFRGGLLHYAQQAGL